MERRTERKKDRHSCFEWLQLFVSILIPVAIGVYTVLENNRDIAIAIENRIQDLEIADNEQKDRVLHECQKVLAKLIERYGQALNGSSAASLVARFATLSALNRLDSIRRSFLVRLLYESQLITWRQDTEYIPVPLESVNLTDLDLRDSAQLRPLLYISLKECLLIRANFHSLNIYAGKFTRSILTNANFDETSNTLHFDSLSEDQQLNKTPELTFYMANLVNASFVRAVYRNASFEQTSMKFVNFQSFFCQHCTFLSSGMTFVNFQGATIEKSLLDFASMNDGHFFETIFGPDVDFFSSSLERINVTYSTFTNCQMNQVRAQNSTFDLSTVVNVTFHNGLLSGVSFRRSSMKNCDFSKADLRFSQWIGTTCENCLFNSADFTGANFSGSKFINSNFINSTIIISHLRTSASLSFVIFPDGTSSV